MANNLVVFLRLLLSLYNIVRLLIGGLLLLGGLFDGFVLFRCILRGLFASSFFFHLLALLGQFHALFVDLSFDNFGQSEIEQRKESLSEQSADHREQSARRNQVQKRRLKYDLNKKINIKYNNKNKATVSILRLY